IAIITLLAANYIFARYREREAVVARQLKRLGLPAKRLTQRASGLLAKKDIDLASRLRIELGMAEIEGGFFAVRESHRTPLAPIGWWLFDSDSGIIDVEKIREEEQPEQ